MSEGPVGASHTALAIAFLVMAMACFAVLDTTVKYVGAFVSILVAVWFRYVFHRDNQRLLTPPEA
jgi:hypothetical protein